MIVLQGVNERVARIGRRQGAALTVLLLFTLPVLLAILCVAVNAAYLAEARTTLQNTADAAALAAVQSLVDDSWLIGDPVRQLNLIGAARSQAQYYAAHNPVLGQPLTLQLPATATANPVDGDIIFAFLDKPRSPVLAERVLLVGDLDSSSGSGPFLPTVNTVRVNARRLQERGTAVGLWGGNFTGFGSVDMVTPATATLDRDVVGFKPVGGEPVPLAPVALLTRATPGVPSSWEMQLQTGQDNWAFHPAGGGWSAGSDFLPEATMAVNADETQASAALLLLGIPDLVGLSGQSTFAGQVMAGVSANDLQGMGGAFTLSASSNRLSVAATRGGPSFYSVLASSLNQIKGQKRIWPLYESFDAVSGQAVVSGFVAARLVEANATVDGVTLILQPCMLSTRTALSSAAQRGVGGVNITNPYICKVRLVE